MAIALDATATGFINNSTSAATWSHTCTGTDRVLLVSLTIENTSGTGTPSATATYNGVSMTKIAERSLTGSCAVFFYLANPATGANTVSIQSSTSGTAAYKYGASLSYTGVDQTTPIDAQSTVDANNSTSQSVSVTTVTANALVIGTYASLQGVTFATATAPNVVRVQFAGDGYTGILDHGAVTASPGSVSVAWTFPGARDPSRMAYALRPVAAPTNGNMLMFM